MIGTAKLLPISAEFLEVTMDWAEWIAVAAVLLTDLGTFVSPDAS